MGNQNEFLKLCVEQLEVGKVVLERLPDNISLRLKDAYKQVGSAQALPSLILLRDAGLLLGRPIPEETQYKVAAKKDENRRPKIFG